MLILMFQKNKLWVYEARSDQLYKSLRHVIFLHLIYGVNYCLCTLGGLTIFYSQIPETKNERRD